MNIRHITPHVGYCGVNDREKPKFDNLYELPTGVSYNSYIVTADTGEVALIDGSDAAHAPQYLKVLQDLLGDRKPDMMVVNHAEPDHTGALPMLRLHWPEMKIVGNSKTFDLLKGFYGIDDNLVEVRDGDTLPLGNLTLQFVMTPMVHWPETMMTLLADDKVLFTGDAFGCFGALDGAVIDDEMDDAERYLPEAERYYSCIVAKYGLFVTKAIEKTGGFDVEYLCTTHGPVWHSLRPKVTDLYARLARWEAQDGVLIVYGSMYGSTTALAEALASQLAADGVRRIRVHDVTHTPESYLLADVMRFSSIVLVAPTYNTDIYPPIECFVRALLERGVTNRRIAVMGTFSWGGQAVRKLQALLAPLKGCELLAVSPEMKQSLLHTKTDEIAALAKLLARNG